MNEAIMKKAGFGEEVNKVKYGYCPFCNIYITEKMKSKMSSADLREFKISGLCSSCQKEMFG